MKFLHLTVLQVSSRGSKRPQARPVCQITAEPPVSPAVYIKISLSHTHTHMHTHIHTCTHTHKHSHIPGLTVC